MPPDLVNFLIEENAVNTTDVEKIEAELEKRRLLLVQDGNTYKLYKLINTITIKS